MRWMFPCGLLHCHIGSPWRWIPMFRRNILPPSLLELTLFWRHSWRVYVQNCSVWRKIRCANEERREGDKGMKGTEGQRYVRNGSSLNFNGLSCSSKYISSFTGFTQWSLCPIVIQGRSMNGASVQSDTSIMTGQRNPTEKSELVT
jgi:hypothetical protein